MGSANGASQETFRAEDGCVYSSDGRVLLSCEGNSATYTIRAGCEEIADRAFERRSELKDVVFPESLHSIGDFAFAFSDIESFEAPAQLRSIGTKAFFRCGALASCELDDALEEIADEAFAETGLERIELPRSVRAVGHRIVHRTPAAANFEAGKIAASPDNPNFVIDDCGALYARKSRGLVLYELMAENVKAHRVLEGTVRIAVEAYRGSLSVESVELPEGLVAIGKGAFRKCANLRAANIPRTVEAIEPDAFYASGLQSIELPAGLEHLGLCALMALKDVRTFEPTLTSVTVDPGNRRFYMKDGLLIERLEDGERLIGHYGPATAVSVPSSVTEIGPYAFLGCDDIDLLELHDGIRRMHYCAFVLGKAVQRVRVRLSEPVDGVDAVEVCFSQDPAQFSMFSRAFFEPTDEWARRSGKKVGWKYFNLSLPLDREKFPAGSGAAGPAGPTVQPSGSPGDLFNSSSVALDQFEGGIDVRHICECADLSVTSMYGDIYPYARLVLRRLDTPQFLSEAHRGNFCATIRRRLPEVVSACAEHGDTKTLGQLMEHGFIDADNIDTCIEAARGVMDVTAAGYLLEVKREHFAPTSFDFGI